MSRFVAQARIAAAALVFYELARKADAETIAKLDAYDEFYPPGVQLDNLDVVEARKWELHAVAVLTQTRLPAWCSPTIFWRGGSLAGGWGFKNLAGAM